jgi:hypothetical protein
MIMPSECAECLKNYMKDGISKVIKQAKQETQQEVLEIIRLRLLCRIRGLDTDIANGYPMELARQEILELNRHLENINWIITDIECAKRRLTDEEEKRFEELKQALTSKIIVQGKTSSKQGGTSFERSNNDVPKLPAENHSQLSRCTKEKREDVHSGKHFITSPADTHNKEKKRVQEIPTASVLVHIENKEKEKE